MGVADDRDGCDGSGRGPATALWLVLALGLLLCATLPGALPAPARGASAPGGAAARTPWALVRAFPRAFDLRHLGRVTEVRQQAHYSTCWAMAAIGSLESNLLPQSRLDLSENALVDHSGSRLVFATWAEGHATSRLATAVFARWDGPVLERQDPYPRPGDSPEGLRPAVHVQEVLFPPGRRGAADNAALKWALTAHGAVDTAMAFNARFLRPQSSSYYCSTPGRALNHHVTCVGWDDGYPASSFRSRPPGDGALLVKNSWGAAWGEAGYFWVSYYDADFGREMAVFDGAKSAGNYDAIYQYDALGWSQSLGFGRETASFANRFRCAGSGTLAAVAFYTPVPGSAYVVRVAGSVGGLNAAPRAAAGTIAVAGYHTVTLDAPVEVRRGRDFVAAVQLTTPGSTRPIPLEAPSALIAPRAGRRQSYVSSDGVSWTDLTTLPGFGSANVCLKAFVTASGNGDTKAPEATLRDASATEGGVARVRWTLTDPPFSCASATVDLEVLDARGLVIQSQRVPAVAVGEAGVWRFRCWLPAGAYRLTARAHDVVGNAQVRAAGAVLRVTAARRGARAAAGS